MRKGAKEKEKRERRKKGAEDAPGCIQKQSGKVKTKTQTPFYFSAFLSPFLPPHRCAGCGGVEKGKKRKKGKEKQNKRRREKKGKRKTLLSFSRAKGKTRRKSRHHFLVEMAGPPLKRAITTTFKVKETTGKSGGLCAVWLARLPKQTKKGNWEMKIYYGTFRNHGINKRKGCCKERDAGKIR